MRGFLRWVAKQAWEVNRVNAVIHVPEARVGKDGARESSRRSMRGERGCSLYGRRCIRA